ncbi:MAG TPA: hypothetical protein VEY67_03675, partial [Candidatus Dormibacteraeota bacterium]|nr:hypothetical protein [Candidatus Dormibacteraeota bacterium]
MSLAATLALLSLFVPQTAGLVLGHDAQGGCGSITLTKSALQADVTVHGTGTFGPNGYVWDTGTLVLTHVAGNATYAIEPGTYDVGWSDGYKVLGVVVTACPSPSPSVEPSASPSTEPSPSPSPSEPEVDLTLIKLICPSYSDVPANLSPATFSAGPSDAWKSLDTSVQTDQVDPS